MHPAAAPPAAAGPCSAGPPTLAPQRRRASVAAAASSSSSQPPPPPCSRAVVILPGLGNNSKDYAQLAGLLQQQRAGGGRLHVEVAGVERLDWGRNAAGLRYGDYWKGTLKPRPTGGCRGWGLVCRAPARDAPALTLGATSLEATYYLPTSSHLPPPYRRAVDWYLQRVAQACEAAKRDTGGAPITLLCHSAGGWLGRCVAALLLPPRCPAWGSDW